MINIYQLFPRLFGNTVNTQIPFGTIEENGCGKLNEINRAAIISLKKLGITHIWLTGILRHACLTDYSQYDIPTSHPQTVKGRAGSPYAINDYYDIDPDLATDPARRFDEFHALTDRIHDQGLKVLIDFVPNHVARQYQSVAKPNTASDFGNQDITHQSFNPANNFYYLPDQVLKLPIDQNAPFKFEKPYEEFPAKVTGNDCFSATPGITDWYETVKLNYGKNYDNHTLHQDPIPDTWNKMYEILHFWASKGVDGFRVDMAAMVPLPFWDWVIRKIKAQYPAILFIAEIYEAHLYQQFIAAGFDFLYDKVGLYNRLEDIIRHGHPAESIGICWKMLNGLDDYMLRFMENHDEPRLASANFVGDPFKALPAVAASALMHKGPFLIYNGQESGEEASGSAGFSGDDGRSSLFDYSHMPQHQNWMNNGSFNEYSLTPAQKELRDFYHQILNLRLENKAVSQGSFYDLMWANPWYTNFDPKHIYAFLRYFEDEILLVILNFHTSESRNLNLNIPEDAQKLASIISTTTRKCWIAENLFDRADKQTFYPEKLTTEGIWLHLEPSQCAIYKLQPIPKNYDHANTENC
ncbi:MAG: alpha-amylase family protein [Bacteroidetes bacterium]|nr:alpha-amylase family protein [Bacteroidota bacterium]MBU1578008.1 alpha-amylase family protein [Bacteroidota bacterium]MBU2466579.1 alpha-amylase family protein [Bacteroidota bacterium]MBU2559151.1 alpha-amylase family protein [Bacteroidota bacterium]